MSQKRQKPGTKSRDGRGIGGQYAPDPQSADSAYLHLDSSAPSQTVVTEGTFASSVQQIDAMHTALLARLIPIPVVEQVPYRPLAADYESVPFPRGTIVISDRIAEMLEREGTNSRELAHAFFSESDSNGTRQLKLDAYETASSQMKAVIDTIAEEAGISFIRRIEETTLERSMESPANKHIAERFAEDAAAAEAAGIRLPGLAANSVLEYRFSVLQQEQPHLPIIRTVQGQLRPSGTGEETDTVWKAYRERFLPQITDDTPVTVYRGDKPGREPFTAGQAADGTGIPLNPNWSGAYFTFSPVFASSFNNGQSDAGSGKIALEVPWGALRQYGSGREHGDMCLSDSHEMAVVLNYTKIPDGVKARVRPMRRVVRTESGSLDQDWLLNI